MVSLTYSVHVMSIATYPAKPCVMKTPNASIPLAACAGLEPNKIKTEKCQLVAVAACISVRRTEIIEIIEIIEC